MFKFVNHDYFNEKFFSCKIYNIDSFTILTLNKLANMP